MKKAIEHSFAGNRERLEARMATASSVLDSFAARCMAGELGDSKQFGAGQFDSHLERARVALEQLAHDAEIMACLVSSEASCQSG